ncbi:MAG: hypothetical protein ACLT2F_04490 [Butyricicoccus sp.]
MRQPPVCSCCWRSCSHGRTTCLSWNWRECPQSDIDEMQARNMQTTMSGRGEHCEGGAARAGRYSVHGECGDGE